ncbi:MAG: hypothetical protein JXB07_08730 [Anaerolineae bacterium]|nr:hypothetical protein [Anaerolineae bacterium]
MRKHYLIPAAVLSFILASTGGCNSRLDANMATFNASATQIAGSGGIIGTPLAMLTPEPTPPPNLYNLIETGDTLVHAWGQVYGLASGSEFTIYATQQQVADFVIATLQLGGWSDTVKGGSTTIGSGQLRLDVAIVDTADNYGAGTLTCQPTIDGTLGVFKLNPLGAQFGSLQIPNGLTAAMGDATQTALTGAKSELLSKVTIKMISLESETMKVSGTVR